MKDQYDSLPKEVYEKTTFINSALSPEELAQRMSEIVAGKYKLVYCAPERLRQQSFSYALRKTRLSMLVIDEAHCVSMWGHDFRPDYLFIGKCLPFFGKPTILALTATATPEIRAEISSQLGRELKNVVSSVFRPNLHYEVEQLDDKEQKLKRLIEICKSESGTGVVYARSRDDCEQLAGMLRRAGVGAAFYHAGMDPESRTRAQEAFMLDKVRVIVATIAFGMGIDKSNVRFIVHFNPPSSLEGYVQESGRAGRDGRDSRCVLLVTSGDRANLSRWKRMDQLKVEQLRSVYREITKRVPAGRAGFLNMGEVESQLSASEGKEVDNTQVRVSISLLERVGLIMRHPDAPRTVTFMVHPGEHTKDAQLARMLSLLHLQPGEYTRRELTWLSETMDLTLPEMDRLLLEWQENGWIDYKGERRDAVIERLQPPADVAAAMNQLLADRDNAQQRQIGQIMDYASLDTCRHQMLAAHLGERIDPCETSCDFCNPPLDRPQRTTQAAPDLPDNPGQVIVECLDSFPFNVGRPSLIKALTGSAASNITADRVKHFGALAGARPTSIDKAITELVEEGYLAVYESEEGYRLLQLTKQGRDGVPSDVVTSIKPKPQKKTDRKADRISEQGWRSTGTAIPRNATLNTQDEQPPTPEEVDTFERLRHWRRVTANHLNLPPYVIFHDKTLWAIARAKPSTGEELIRVKGMGKTQVEKYGSELLELLSQE
jgi:ATP-dependent DNA helicase RecQ